ncbi:hypothetical protein D3C72_834610 [compost metagenome]
MEQRGGNVGELPLIAVELGFLGETRTQQVTLFVEVITGHAIQQAVGLHGVDVDELFTLTVPHTVLGALRVAAALRQRAIGLGHAFGRRSNVLADQYAGQHQHQHWFHYSPDDPADGHASGAHDGQLTAAGQTAEADQAADQCGHWQHFVETAWRGQQYEAEDIDEGVGVADVAHLIDEGKQGRQTKNDCQHGDDRHEHAAADVTVEFNHGPPPALQRDGWPSSDAAAPNRANRDR